MFRTATIIILRVSIFGFYGFLKERHISRCQPLIRRPVWATITIKLPKEDVRRFIEWLSVN